MLWGPISSHPKACSRNSTSLRAHPRPCLQGGARGPSRLSPRCHHNVGRRGSPRVPEAKLPPPSLEASEASWAAVTSQCSAGKPWGRDGGNTQQSVHAKGRWRGGGGHQELINACLLHPVTPGTRVPGTVLVSPLDARTETLSYKLPADHGIRSQSSQ